MGKLEVDCERLGITRLNTRGQGPKITSVTWGRSTWAVLQ